MKNTGFISKLDTDMERKSEFQNITQETVQSEIKRKKSEDYEIKVQNNCKRCNYT